MKLTLEELKEKINEGEIDTVVIGCVDMSGQLIGKRATGRYFLENAISKIGMSYSHLAMTVDGMPSEGYEIANWGTGWNNCAILADLNTLRIIPWMEGTALVIADPMDPETNELVYCSPRIILRQQIERLAKLELKSLFASELEFHLFNESQESARKRGWKELKTPQQLYQWMNIQASSLVEPIMRKIRNGLEGAGILLEATHPEFEASQQELNFEPADPLEMADRHILTKQGIHEMTKQANWSATFMAKYDSNKSGSSCHIHTSLLDAKSGKNAFYDENNEFGMSKLMRNWIGGLIKYAKEYTYFLAPYVNSYKRLQPNTFAPTKCCWALDNRTSAFRLCNQRTSGVHVEIRVGGADLNPYLAYSAIIAAGIAGIEEELEIGPPEMGNIYNKNDLPKFPHSLKDAIQAMEESKMLQKAFGPKTFSHYLTAARNEQSEFEKQVTDWELRRAFDRC